MIIGIRLEEDMLPKALIGLFVKMEYLAKGFIELSWLETNPLKLEFADNKFKVFKTD